MKYLFVIFAFVGLCRATPGPTNIVWSVGVSGDVTCCRPSFPLALSADESFVLTAYTYENSSRLWLVAYDARNGGFLWEYEDGIPYNALMLGDDNTVYIMGDAQRGTDRFQVLRAVRGGIRDWSLELSFADDLSLLPSGEILAARSDWMYKIDPRSPTILQEGFAGGPGAGYGANTADGIILRNGYQAIAALDANTFGLRWRREGDHSGPTPGPSVIVGKNNEVFQIGGYSDDITQRDPQSGEPLGVIAGDQVLVGPGNALTIFTERSVLRRTGGNLIWASYLTNETFLYHEAALLENGSVLVPVIFNDQPARPTWLYHIAGGNGKINWSWRFPESPYSGAKLIVSRSGRVYATSTDHLYCLEGTGAGLARSPWPMQRQNPQLTSLSPGPLFLAPLADQDAVTGDQVLFAAQAVGKDPKYQWFVNDAPVPGATNSTFAIDSVAPGDAAVYAVEISTSGGVLRSRSAQLRVVSPEVVNVTNLVERAFPALSGVVAREDGSVFVASAGQIWHLAPSGALEVWAGREELGFRNGSGTNALFSGQLAPSMNASNGRLLVADSGNNLIREIDPYLGHPVQTVAGTVEAGFRDGAGPNARFRAPSGIAVSSLGEVYISDQGNHAIRTIDRDRTVGTLAGDGASGFSDGAGKSARFASPSGLALGFNGVLYVADQGNHSIRKISRAGVVETLAGNGRPGFQDGAGALARFRSPKGVAVDSEGSIYVADSGNHAIRKVSPNGLVLTLAGDGLAGLQQGPSEAAQFDSPNDLAVPPDQNIIVADAGNAILRRITFPGRLAPIVTLKLRPVLTIWGMPGQTFEVQMTEYPENPESWRSVDQVVLTGNAAYWVDPDPSALPKRFYRAHSLTGTGAMPETAN